MLAFGPADATGLTGGFSEALARSRQRQGSHDAGRVAIDVAVMLADGACAPFPHRENRDMQ